MKNDRFSKNVPGDFYTIAEKSKDGEWHGACLECGLPEEEAPDLLSPLSNGDEFHDTYFIKQPSTYKEIEQAIAAMDICCVNAIRYGGSDPEILKLANPDACDNMQLEYIRSAMPNESNTFAAIPKRLLSISGYRVSAIR